MHEYFLISSLESLVKDGLGSQLTIIGKEGKIIMDWNANSYPFLENWNMKDIMNFGLGG
jgi:hypothetical protein